MDPSGDIFWVADYNNGLVKLLYNPESWLISCSEWSAPEANWAMDCKNGDPG